MSLDVCLHSGFVVCLAVYMILLRSHLGLTGVSHGSCSCYEFDCIALVALVILLEAYWQACDLSLLFSVSITVQLCLRCGKHYLMRLIIGLVIHAPLYVLWLASVLV